MFGFKTASSARANGRVRRSVVAPSSAAHAAWRGFTVTFSPGGVVASVIGFVVVLAWVFFFGIIVGRGLNPETKMPGASILAQADPEQEEPREEIFKPEELTFLNDLKQSGNARRPVGTAPAQPPPSAPSEKPQAQTGQADVKTAPSSTPAPSAAQPASVQPAAPKTAMQDYVIQVVAYKSPAPADALRERLEGAGLRTRMVREKGTGKKATWYRVQVLLRGTDESAAAAKETLVRMGIKDAVIVSSRPVGKK